MKCGFNTMSQRANARVWNRKTQCSVRKEVQISVSSGKCYAHTFLGFEVTSPWTLSRKRCNNKQYTLQWEYVMSWSQWFGVNTKDNCQKALCCCSTELISIPLPTLLKHSSSYTVRSEYTPYRHVELLSPYNWKPFLQELEHKGLLQSVGHLKTRTVYNACTKLK
jgi:hypothetical protein